MKETNITIKATYNNGNTITNKNVEFLREESDFLFFGTAHQIHATFAEAPAKISLLNVRKIEINYKGFSIDFEPEVELSWWLYFDEYDGETYSTLDDAIQAAENYMSKYGAGSCEEMLEKAFAEDID